MQKFGERLRWVIEERDGILQREAAERIGVDRFLLNRWLCEPTKNPNLKNAMRCAEVFGVSKCWLIFGEGSPEPEEK